MTAIPGEHERLHDIERELQKEITDETNSTSVSRSNRDGYSSVSVDQDERYMDAVNRYNTATTEEERQTALAEAQAMVIEATERAGFTDTVPEQTRAYTLRTGKPPKRTIKVYKVFTVDEKGRPSALFVSSKDTLPQNVWLDANDTFTFTDTKNGKKYIPSTKNPNTKGGKTGVSHETANISAEDLAKLEKLGYIKRDKSGKYPKTITALAYRPGWHAGDLAFHDMQKMPIDGGYKFATNPMANHSDIGSWFISGSLKIGRTLTEEECNKILAKNGYKPQEWQAYGAGNNFVIGKLDLAKLGYTGEGFDAARKTIAPITYDDMGEVIPLSERFDASKPWGKRL